MEDQVSAAAQTLMARKISIKCTFCGASTREFLGLMADEIEDAQIMAIEAWNIRPKKKGRG